jgi:hypothetical protein
MLSIFKYPVERITWINEAKEKRIAGIESVPEVI